MHLYPTIVNVAEVDTRCSWETSVGLSPHILPSRTRVFLVIRAGFTESATGFPIYLVDSFPRILLELLGNR
jgi:hypothetical protein